MVTVEDEQETGCVIRNLSSEVPPEVEIWRKCACAREKSPISSDLLYVCSRVAILQNFKWPYLRNWSSDPHIWFRRMDFWVIRSYGAIYG